MTVITAFSLSLTLVSSSCLADRLTDTTSTNGPTVLSVTVAPKLDTLDAQQTATFTATVETSDGAPRAVTWESSDPSVATVNGSGVVTAAAAGRATIRAKSGGKSDSATVVVSLPPDSPPPDGPPPDSPPPDGSLSVVPGVSGFGVTTLAGRGGRVIKVTNLNDAGAGSLREALDATGARVVVFEVSGTIPLVTNLAVRNPFLTIAGQTAPSPGITLRGATLSVRTHDVLIQHIRLRVGDDPSGPNPDDRDGLQLLGPGLYNVVVDHVSTSWGIDENASTWDDVHDVTFNQSIISEGLSHSTHPKGEHSKGLLVGDHAKRVAIIGNLFAHNFDRNAAVKSDVQVLMVNNVIYNWATSGATENWDDGTGLPSQSTIVGNVFLPGANTQNEPTKGLPVLIRSSMAPGTKVYVSDNQWFRATSDPWSVVRIDPLAFDPKASSPPVWTSPLTVRPSGTVEAWVLANAGSRPADRDAVDARVVNEVRTRTGRIIDSQSQVGGWPVLAANRRALTPPATPNADDDGDGYTNLEEWLQQFAAEVEGRTP